MKTELESFKPALDTQVETKLRTRMGALEQRIGELKALKDKTKEQSAELMDANVELLTIKKTLEFILNPLGRNDELRWHANELQNFVDGKPLSRVPFSAVKYLPWWTNSNAASGGNTSPTKEAKAPVAAAAPAAPAATDKAGDKEKDKEKVAKS
jgi:hypothetical protein